MWTFLCCSSFHCFLLKIHVHGWLKSWFISNKFKGVEDWFYCCKLEEKKNQLTITTIPSCKNDFDKQKLKSLQKNEWDFSTI